MTEQQTASQEKAHPSPRKIINPQSTTSESGKLTTVKPALKSALKSFRNEEAIDPFPPGSPLARSAISGAASAKLSYLLDRVIALHLDEKILIFYEGDHIAYYIAQALDLVDVRYLIYTRTLSLERQNAYITTFNTTETFRVLLMNVHLAAHGLHIATASRVFFVNPVWQPNVEAQAIKRAHRIGQLRPVYVETLVLKDTLEDQMLQRRKGMTVQEHQKAEKSLLDDDTMSTIIKNAQFIPLSREHMHDVNKHVAKLSVSQQLFGRATSGDRTLNDPDADLILDSSQSKKPSRKRQLDILVSDYAPSQRESRPSRESSRNPTLAFAGGTDLAEASVAGDSAHKQRSDSEHAPELCGPPSPKKRTANVRFRTIGDANASESSTADDASRKRESDAEYLSDLTTSPLNRKRPANVTFHDSGVSGSIDDGASIVNSVHQPPSKQVDARPRKRVGFSLNVSADEPAQSLFGGSASIT